MKGNLQKNKVIIQILWTTNSLMDTLSELQFPSVVLEIPFWDFFPSAPPYNQEYNMFPYQSFTKYYVNITRAPVRNASSWSHQTCRLSLHSPQAILIVFKSENYCSVLLGKTSAKLQKDANYGLEILYNLNNL